MNPVSFVVFPREKHHSKRKSDELDANPMQIRCESDANPMQIRCTSDANPMHTIMPSPHRERERDSERRRKRERGRKRTRKRKRNLRLEKDLLPTRSSLIQAGSSRGKCFTHSSGGKKLPILPQARSSSGCIALTCVAALHAEFNFVF